ncbi:MAG: hypothetical protein ACLFVQ_05220 [Chitinispirillaceae bacterium]
MTTLIIATYSFILLFILSSALPIMFSWQEFKIVRDRSSEQKDGQPVSDMRRCGSHTKSERKQFSLLHLLSLQAAKESSRQG